MDTKRNVHEIEMDVARHFGWRENIIVPNVSWGFFRTHEADLVIINKTGYLTEVEIKRSWQDFLADFKKHTNHYEGKVDKLYYCIPESLYDKVRDYLVTKVDWSKYKFDYDPRTRCVMPCGIMTYSESGYIRERISAPAIQTFFYKNRADYKLFIEEQLAIARLGTLRYWSRAQKQHDNLEERL